MADTTTMRGIREAVLAYAARFDPALVSAADAEAVMADAAAAENALAHVKALAAARAGEAGVWRRRGERSAAHHLARATGTSVAAAKDALDTAARAGALGDLDAAARRGELSPAQAAPIARAAGADPRSEARLVEQAKGCSVGELRDECERTRAAADADGEARHARIHAERYARRRRCGDGAAEITYHSTPEEVAEVWAVVCGYADRAFAAARSQSRREPAGAYAGDAVLAMARAAAPAATPAPGSDGGGEGGDGGPRPRRRPALPAKIVVRVDWDALVRGWPVGEEVCEIAGLGPVAVSVVRAMVQSGDHLLAAVVTKGRDVASVAHLGRRPSAHQMSALEWLSPTCMVLGCNATANLEVDHRHDWATTRLTLLAWLDRACAFHHDKKTYEGWALVAGVGKRPMVAPDDPRHPSNVNATGPPGQAA